MSVQQATRRYVLLTVLRWLPVGLTLPVSVLLALSRGLTIADVGLVLLAHSLVVVVMELPTGGLADALGRRPVLVASGLLHLLACGLFATADSLAGFVLAACTQAVGRALDSGPLQAWYVDAVHDADADADVTPGLARAGVADCLALALGAVAGGLAPALLAGAPSSLLLLPYAAAAVLDLVSVVAVLLLVTSGSPRTTSVGAALRSGLAEVPRTVGGAVRLATRDAVLRRVLLLSLVCGVALSTLELFGPLLFVELSGSTTGGSSVFGGVMAVSFLAGAAGSALAPRSRRLARGSAPWAVTGLTAASGLSLAAVGASSTVLLAALAYAGFYLANAASWPLLHAVLHGRVLSAQRATVLSASSLALQLGGGLANGGAFLRERVGGTGAVYLLTGALVVAASLVGPGLRRTAPQTAADGLQEPPPHARAAPAGQGLPG